MNSEQKERRKNERVFFSLEENRDITVDSLGKSKTTRATLLSISAGGISFSASKEENKHIAEGDKLTISKLHLPGLHEAIARIEAEVRYIFFYKDYDQMSIGCEFKEISAPVKEKIEAFINERLELEKEEEEDSKGLEV
jgi:c-di-GMP-binding flagellar brake protein YcgR